ncbi:MAG: hypothetical protein WC431_05140 [Candidatus Omnitrophota bacterium]|jgi:hypothetical protein
MLVKYNVLAGPADACPLSAIAFKGSVIVTRWKVILRALFI